MVRYISLTPDGVSGSVSKVFSCYFERRLYEGFYMCSPGSDRDTVGGSHHVTATTEGEDGIASLSAATGPRQMGESLQRTGNVSLAAFPMQFLKEKKI